MEPSSEPHTPRDEETARGGPSSTPPSDDTAELLARESLPPRKDRELNEGPSPEAPPPPPEQSSAPPGINAELGRFHLTAAAGIGSSIAYIGLALGAGETISGVMGLAAYCFTQGRFMVGIEDECTHKVLTETGSVALPPEYMRGAMSVFIPTVAMSFLGYTHPETYAGPALMALFGGTVLFSALYRDGGSAKNDTSA